MEWKEWNGFKVSSDGTVIGRSGKEVGGWSTGYKLIGYRENGASTAIGAHVLVYKLFIGDIPEGMNVDHINSIKHDNRVENLQLLTTRGNGSKPHERPYKSSRFTGVHWHKQRNKWCAQIVINKKQKHLGIFDTEEEAHQAYQKELVENNLK